MTRPGTVVIPTQHTGRFTEFYTCLMATELPPGSGCNVMMGPEIAENRNNGIRQMVGDWVWFVDDDNYWQPNLISKLLERDVDIIVPLSIKKVAPFSPLVYSGVDEDSNYTPTEFSDYDSDLIEVYAAGTGGMLVKKYVLDVLEDPWFEMGKLFTNYTSEDLYFCHKAKKAGFKIWCDLSLRIGHIHMFTGYPLKSDGQWGIEVDIAGSKMFVPYEMLNGGK